MKTTVVIEKCDSYEREAVVDAVRRCVEHLGGMSRFVRPGRSVLLKPNLLRGAKPGKAVVTHPEVVRAAALSAREAGGEVSLGDSPSLTQLANTLAQSGYDGFMREIGVRAQPFEEVREVDTGIEGPLHRIEIAAPPLDADVVINLPKLKTHAQMYMTLAVKNLFGCIAGKRKLGWHLKAGRDYEHFGRMLLQVAKAVSPALTIVDGIVGMEGNGPQSGTPRRLGVIIAGTDCAAVDVVICKMLSIDPDLLYTHKAAREAGWGVTDLSDIELKGVSLDEVTVHDFKPARRGDLILPLPAFAKRRLRRLFTSRPIVNVEACRLCGECGRICPAEAISMDREIIIDYDKCIRCFCCQEMCPHGAINVREGLLARWLGGT